MWRILPHLIFLPCVFITAVPITKLFARGGGHTGLFEKNRFRNLFVD